ncbi:MAG: enoyl-CoA hydratase [Actinomycetia bacterium]|nr:enoyl-CoA hydratase [Actinomycetes bacterium]MCP4962383.1 enoyl-CoA hydratase [Actinomycetes bacterium]
MIDLERDGDVFILTMNAGENRWNTTFTRAISAAIDEVEASTGPAALVTTSAHEKFFSNGLDLDWVTSSDEHPGGDRAAFGTEFMDLMGRLITLPMPTIAAVNGHGFGAGFMVALTHDIRIMREDRGYLCANELEIGLTIPIPEVALFRHKMSASAFNQTVLLARRWTAPDAIAAGFVDSAFPLDGVREGAIRRAAGVAHLATDRKKYGWQKESIYGENSVLNGPHGAGHVLKNAADYLGPRP